MKTILNAVMAILVVVFFAYIAKTRSVGSDCLLLLIPFGYFVYCAIKPFMKSRNFIDYQKRPPK